MYTRNSSGRRLEPVLTAHVLTHGVVLAAILVMGGLSALMYLVEKIGKGGLERDKRILEVLQKRPSTLTHISATLNYSQLKVLADLKHLHKSGYVSVPGGMPDPGEVKRRNPRFSITRKGSGHLRKLEDGLKRSR